MDEINDTAPTAQAPIAATTLLAFARELRILAARVERDLRRNETVAALSALTALKPIAGTLTDAALSEVWSQEAQDDPSTKTANTPNQYNPQGYV